MTTRFRICFTLMGLFFLNDIAWAQTIKPLNSEFYNVETRFYQAFGTIGSDGSGNNPDPSWVVKTASDVNNSPTSLLSNAPFATNTGAYCYYLTTSSNDWHAVQNALINTITNNATGAFDYEVMSYENDYQDRCIYHADPPGQNNINDDDNMNFKEGLISFKNKTIGVYHQTEIDVSAPVVRSKVRLRYAWRPSHGTKASPLDFGEINDDCNTYEHVNSTLVANAANPNLVYLNEWDAAANANFTAANDVTYTFELNTMKRFLLNANLNFNAIVHLVSIDNSGNLTSYLVNNQNTGVIDQILPAGNYAIVIEGDQANVSGSFGFTLQVQDWQSSRVVPSTFPDGIIYVNDNATGNQSGASWSNAIKDLHFALKYADKNTPIWVAMGTYYASYCADIFDSFIIPDSIKIFGNFEGNESATFDLTNRDLKNLQTYLEGDFFSDKVLHVVYTENVSHETVLDGFVIRNGHSDGATDNDKWGGGWLNKGSGTGNKSTPTVRNCLFISNMADKGGAFYDLGEDGEASTQFENCVFENNTASTHGGGYYGNGINGESSANFSNSKFRNNNAFAGGGVFIHTPNGESKGVWTNNLFENHNINGPGGAAVLQGVSETTVFNSIFYNNDDYHIWYDPTTTEKHPTFVNCTLVGAEDFAVSFTSLVTASSNNKLSFINTIFRDNNGDISGPSNDRINLSHCIVEESYFNNVNNNIQLNPLFIQSGRNFGLRLDSPAKNNGTQVGLTLPAKDFLGRSRVFGQEVDIGAHEAIDKVYVGLDSKNPNGESWETAQDNLADALLECKEVWVKKGVYKNNQVYEVSNNTKLYGSFEGTEPNNYDLSQRNYVLNETILDGNNGDLADSTDNRARIISMFNASDQTVVDGFTISNAYWPSSGNSAIYISTDFDFISGPTISNCSFKNNTGGAIQNRCFSGKSSPLIKNCSFINNDASSGGAISIIDSYSSFATFLPEVNVKIEACTFANNRASMTGGAIYTQTDTASVALEIKDCEFVFNQSNSDGGALSINNFEGDVRPVFSNCTFTGNVANTSNGGGIYTSSFTGVTKLKIENSTIENNIASNGAGILFNSQNSPSADSASSLEIINTKILNNTTNSSGGGSGVYISSFDPFFKSVVSNSLFAGNIPNHLALPRRNDGFKENKYVNCTFQGASVSAISFNNWNGTTPTMSDFLNCIFWGNNNDIVEGSSSLDNLINVEHCIVEEAQFAPANNNLFQDPLFKNPTFGDFKITAASPAKNTGKNDFNNSLLALGNTSRIIQNQIDIGAYEIAERTYVNHSSTGLNTGSTWQDAFNNLQDALPQKGEIWVAHGTYVPTASTDRTISFVLSDSTQLYGGFSGSEPFDFDISNRNLIQYETILSGNIGASNSNFDNSYHVLTITNSSENSLIDGITIKDGRANGGSGYTNGGGIWFLHSNMSTSRTDFNNVTFKDNYGLLGGGIGFTVDGGVLKASFNNSEFDNNSSTAGGAAFLDTNAGLMEIDLSHSKVQNNVAQVNGGGFYNYNGESGSLTFTGKNNLFYNNVAGNLGGALMNLSKPGNTLNFSSTNSTFVKNKAKNGGALYASLDNEPLSSQIFKNGIFWDNLATVSGKSIYQKDASLSVEHSLVEESNCVDLDKGEGTHSVNCDAGMIYNQNPLFIDATNQVFHLDCNSPAINQGLLTGAPLTDINHFTRVGNPDMGAFEFGYQQFEDEVAGGSNTSVTGLPYFLLKQKILNTNNASYEAAQAVELLPGFEVSPSMGQASVFEAKIGGGCL